jgi:ribosomal protein S18 acetylase RimI-like enzyme
MVPTGPTDSQERRARPAKGDLRLLCNVQVHGADGGLQRLLDEARELSEVTFGEDCLRDITKKSRWQLTLLVSSDQLFGFIVTKVVNGSLSIAKLAVSPECRGMGLGKHFMEEVVKAAKKRGDVYEVCLSSLAAAVTFYQRLGFKAFKGLKVAVDFEVAEGQVYMEKKLRPRPRREKKMCPH